MIDDFKYWKKEKLFLKIAALRVEQPKKILPGSRRVGEEVPLVLLSMIV